MTHHDLIDRVAELLHERPAGLRNAGVTNELNPHGWLGAPNLRLVSADPRRREISPGFWIAEHHRRPPRFAKRRRLSSGLLWIGVQPDRELRLIVVLPARSASSGDRCSSRIPVRVSSGATGR